MIEIAVRGSPRPALIDDCDSTLAARSWRLDRGGYAITRVYAGKRNGKSVHRDLSMARAILALRRGDGFIVDHINRDRLDNRRVNLRIVDSIESARNRGRRARLTSREPGVYWDDRHQHWKAIGREERRLKHLGYFENEEEAIAARRLWAAGRT